MARPVYTAPCTSAICCAVLPPFHPEIVPSTASKIQRAGAPLTTKSVVGLFTTPVGVPWARPAAGGIVTSVAFFVSGLPLTSPAYRVDVPAPSLATQKGLVALRATPQGFLSCSSTTRGAPPG